MNSISGNTAQSIASMQAVSPSPELAQAKLQAGILKKSLEMQKTDSAAFLQMLDGKGRTIDIRA